MQWSVIPQSFVSERTCPPPNDSCKRVALAPLRLYIAVSALKRELKELALQRKAAAKEKQAERRETESDHRQLQTAATVMALELANRIIARADTKMEVGGLESQSKELDVTSPQPTFATR